MSALSKLLQKAEELNIPCQNLISREDFERPVKDTIIRNNNPICTKYLNELKKQQIN